MKIAVVGLWHLGTVTAACLASAGHDVLGLDEDRERVAGLQKAELPVAEPGLAALTQEGLSSGKLKFSTEPAALAGCQVVWITYDTPVDEQDRADTEFVLDRVRSLLPHLDENALVVVSSQLPVGSVRKLEAWARQSRPEAAIHFAYIPENLRLGKAIEIFRNPDRFVAGVRHGQDRARIAELLVSFGERMEWMSVESAEMTKHALNAFLATSVAFMNEIAGVCEKTGADAMEVERGLKSERRIGPAAYLHPGSAFAGGTLARDIAFLQEIGKREGLPVHLINGVRQSNLEHKHWSEHKIESVLGDLHGRTITVLGLTYKPGTNTLRRSSAVETCRYLAGRGALVHAHDPAIQSLPADLANTMTLHGSAEEAIRDAEALLIATEWPEFRSLTSDAAVSEMKRALVFDPARFLQATLGADERILYFAIGMGDATKG